MTRTTAIEALMNLIEARKLAHEGWVRSPSQTGNRWVRLRGHSLVTEDNNTFCWIDGPSLDAEDWEPKPAPAKLFEADAFLHPDGALMTTNARTGEFLVAAGWRKIRVREVVE